MKMEVVFFCENQHGTRYSTAEAENMCVAHRASPPSDYYDEFEFDGVVDYDMGDEDMTMTQETPPEITTPAPCISSPCSENATCTDDFNTGFVCLCPPSWMEGVQKITVGGLLCDERIVDITAPVISNIAPLFGPIAGGTILTLTGQYFTKFFPHTLAIGLRTPAFTTGSGMSDTRVTFRSPAANASDVGTRQLITVEFNTGLKLATPFAYQYKGNPEIGDIFPLDHIISGGTSLTVTGTNMDAVAVPVLEITQIYTYMIPVGESYNVNITLYESKCQLNTTTSMNCPMPTLNLPAEFLPKPTNASSGSQRRKRDTVRHKYWPREDDSDIDDDLVYIPFLKNQSDHSLIQKLEQNNERNPMRYESKHLDRSGAYLDIDKAYWTSRRKRETGRPSQVPTVEGNSTLDFIVGFQLDGFDKFEDVSETLPDIKITFYGAPAFELLDDILVFNPDEMPTISLKGSGLLIGASEGDFNVTLGLSQCKIIKVLDNLITCEPAKEIPDYHGKDLDRCGKELFAIIVFVGFSENIVGCLKYDPRSSLALLYIVLIACIGGVLFLLLALLVPVCCYYKRRKRLAQSILDHRSQKYIGSDTPKGVATGSYINTGMVKDDSAGKMGNGGYMPPRSSSVAEGHTVPTEHSTFISSSDQTTWTHGQASSGPQGNADQWGNHYVQSPGRRQEPQVESYLDLSQEASPVDEPASKAKHHQFNFFTKRGQRESYMRPVHGETAVELKRLATSREKQTAPDYINMG